ncbi:carbohydrate ABC transporter permease [Microbacterium lacticum]
MNSARAAGSNRRRLLRRFEPLLWLGPVLILLLVVVIYPIFEMISAAFSEMSRSGIPQGFAGFDNFISLFALPDLGHIILQTLLWLVAVVGLTLVISWPIALLLNQHFPGRVWVRYAVIVPWAAALVMTSLIFKWIYNYYYGALNAVLMGLGILKEPVDWLGSPALAWVSLIVVGVFVSVPFNTYVLLAGLQSVPHEMYEAARLDGAGHFSIWLHITRPMLRSSVMVAVALNIIGVFNSFPVIWLLTGGGPNRMTHTTITYMYELAFRSRSLGEAAALSVVNFAALIVIIVIYLRFQRKNNEVL